MRTPLQTPFVAFEVYYSGTFATVQDHETMKFDVIALNVGNGYNAQTGMFTAPVSGYYMFHTKVTPTDLGEVYLYLEKEGQGVDSVYARDDNYQQTGDSARIVQMAKGERVWLVKDHGEKRIHAWVWSKMSGYLLQATP
nr:hypothetical protein BaRGS_002957 [Batillaria attramentaria]